MARTRVTNRDLQAELHTHAERDERNHTEMRRAIDKLTGVVLDSLQAKQTLDVAERKATISDKADRRKAWRAVGKKVALVVLAVAGAIAGAAAHGCVEEDGSDSRRMGIDQDTHRPARGNDAPTVAGENTKGHDDE